MNNENLSPPNIQSACSSLFGGVYAAITRSIQDGLRKLICLWKVNLSIHNGSFGCWGNLSKEVMSCDIHVQ